MIYIKKYGILGAIVLLGIFSFILSRPSQNTQEEFELPKILESDEVSYIYVDVKGAVHKPGVYKLQDNSRLFQAIELSGGLLNNADDSNVNLSQLLTDQMLIYIPRVGETINLNPSAGSSSDTIININTANQSALETLPGVGPATAANIIAYRTEIGAFETIEDIMNVSGIGEETFANMADYITV